MVKMPPPYTVDLIYFLNKVVISIEWYNDRFVLFRLMLESSFEGFFASVGLGGIQRTRMAEMPPPYTDNTDPIYLRNRLMNKSMISIEWYDERFCLVPP